MQHSPSDMATPANMATLADAVLFLISIGEIPEPLKAFDLEKVLLILQGLITLEEEVSEEEDDTTPSVSPIVLERRKSGPVSAEENPLFPELVQLIHEKIGSLVIPATPRGAESEDESPIFRTVSSSKP